MSKWWFTREEFTKWYGPHPDWLWDILVRNYEQILKERAPS